jgi:hypothetical protein
VTAAGLLIGLLVLGLVIYRQLIPRRVRSNWRIVLILAVTFSVQRLLVQARAQRAAIPAHAGPASFA